MEAVKLHAGHIEYAVAKLLNWRVYTIVPNVSWGLGLKHECDMLALDKSGRFTEIEIKVTPSDLKADFKKGHNHESQYISRLIYAMPQKMVEKYADLIPKHCGIIGVKQYSHGLSAYWYRQARKDLKKPKPPIEVVMKFMSLGCMRIWDLKFHRNKALAAQP